jgi:hypothetical protein
MTQQGGNYGYDRDTARSQGGHLADQVAERTKAAADKTVELGKEALDRADEWLRPVGLSIKQRPMTCLAVVSGLAFAAGALWMLRSPRQQSQVGDLLSHLSDLPRKFRT